MNVPTLVFIHGYPFDHTMWDHVTALLDPGVRVLAPDLRGFGEQPVGDEAPSVDLMAEDIFKLLDQQNVARAVLAGMSMGGVAKALSELLQECST